MPSVDSVSEPSTTGDDSVLSTYCIYQRPCYRTGQLSMFPPVPIYVRPSSSSRSFSPFHSWPFSSSPIHPKPSSIARTNQSIGKETARYKVQV